MIEFHHTESFAVSSQETGKTYIWPTHQGMFYFTVLLVMLLGSLNYKNNMGMMLTFLLAGIFLISMFITHRTLSAISLSRITTTSTFAGDPMAVHLTAASGAEVPTFDFIVAGSVGNGTLKPDRQETFCISLPTVNRGGIALDRVRIETVYPLGLFRAWRTFHFEGAYGVVYPSPRHGTLPFDDAGVGDGIDGVCRPKRGAEDFIGHRPYQPGDPPRDIDWRAFARGSGLFSKTFASPGAGVVQLVWDRLPVGDPEFRISVMCHAVMNAHHSKKQFGMVLPWTTIAPGAGSHHTHVCLRHLSLANRGKIS